MAEETHSFSEILNHPAALFVFGKKDAREAFVDHLVENDADNLIAPQGFVTDLHKADVFVYLLEGWGDVGFAPWQKELEPIYRDVKNTEDAAQKATYTTTANGNDVRFVFYNRSAVPSAPIKCLALDFLDTLGSIAPDRILDRDDCGYPE
ncbi:MAG: hypothetical protein R8G34_09385 [Paracoccaceae bacterium]|nr:hypothetical protein [Paracoccaceae bacterium]